MNSNNNVLRVTNQICRICNTSKHEKVIADRLIRSLPENEVFGGKLKIVECTECGLRYLNAMPHPDDLPLIYNYEVYGDSTNNNQILQELFADMMFKYATDISRVLEVGCGTGEFLAYLESRGVDVSGVEFADSSRHVKFKGMLYEGRIEDVRVPKCEYDAIFLLNVLEHLVDVQAVLKKIGTLLKKRGIVIIRHPNSDMYFNPIYKYVLELPKYLIHRTMKTFKKQVGFTVLGFQNQHLFYYNYKTMREILTKCGYTIELYTTKDVYNLSRIKKAFQRRRYLECAVAAVRHFLGHVGLGPECVFIARWGDGSVEGKR